MPNIRILLKTLDRILLAALVLFSLSSCRVKETLFEAVNAKLVKPLNQAKTTTSGSCSYLQSDHQRISVAKKYRLNKPAASDHSKHILQLNFFPPALGNNLSSLSSGNSPPKYILFKRLKIDIA